MKRILFCLPICLVLAPENLPLAPQNKAEPGLPLAEVVDDGSSLPTPEEMTLLAQTDPVGFLEACLKRYEREVQGYRVSFFKHEKIDGVEHPPEVIAVDFREEPFSVRFDWKQGRRLAQQVLYVKDQNDNQLVVRLAGLLAYAGLVQRDVDGEDARSSGRYPISEFGLKVGTQRTLTGWVAAQKQGALHVEYLGEQAVPELNGRVCWVLRRSRYQQAEDDGVTELTIYVDRESWLQTGSRLRGVGGSFIADYFFRDVELNPDLAETTFSREGL